MYRDSKKPQQTQNTMLFEPHSSHENPKSLPSSAPSNFTPSMELPDPQHYRPVLAAALRMADKAVSLDSEKNYDGAIVAYADTLKLIECILERPGMDAVRDKLIGTYASYSSRITELQQLDLRSIQSRQKALPPQPINNAADIEEDVNEDFDDADTIGIAVSENPSVESLSSRNANNEAPDEDQALTGIVNNMHSPSTFPRGHGSRDSEAIVWYDTACDSSNSSRSSQMSQRYVDHDLDGSYFEADAYSSESDAEDFETAMNAAVELAYQNDVVVEEKENGNIPEYDDDTIYLSGDRHKSATLDELCQKTRRRPPPSNEDFFAPLDDTFNDRGEYPYEKRNRTSSQASIRNSQSDTGKRLGFSMNSFGGQKRSGHLQSEKADSTSTDNHHSDSNGGTKTAGSGSWLNSWVVKSFPKISTSRRPA